MIWPSPFLKMISLFWNRSSDMMSGFSQFSQSGLLAEDMILQSSSLPYAQKNKWQIKQTLGKHQVCIYLIKYTVKTVML